MRLILLRLAGAFGVGFVLAPVGAMAVTGAIFGAWVIAAGAVAVVLGVDAGRTAPAPGSLTLPRPG